MDQMEYWDDQMMKRSEDLENNNRYGKVGWILNKGLSVGKMILVTGFVISSAPVILPPFVVMSAIGFACSLPYGIFLASYAFTGQLMTKLLPTPPSSSNKLVVLDYYITNNYGESNDMSVADAGGRRQFGGDHDVIDMAGKEEFEEPILFSDNIMGSKGIIIRRDDDRQGLFLKDHDHDHDHKQAVLVENGYDQVDDVEEDEDHKAREKPVIEQGKEEAVVLDIETSDQVMMNIIVNEEYESSTGSNIVLKEEEELGAFELSRTEILLIEKIGDEAVVRLQDEIKTSGSTTVENNIVDQGEIDERNAQDTAGRINDDTSSARMDQVGQDIVEENVNKAIPFESEDEVKEILVSSTSTTVLITEMMQNVSSTVLLEKIDIVDESSAKLGREQRNSTIALVPNDQDAREIADESGLYLFDDKQAAGGFQYCNYRIPQGGSEQSSYQVYEVTLPTTVDGSKGIIITSEKDNQYLTAGNGKVVLYSTAEDKIWKEIHAMRAIVGYTASVQGTCMEELRALYLFTGVEPPPSFDQDPSDLVEVNDKLRFLMTIVGVK